MINLHFKVNGQHWSIEKDNGCFLMGDDGGTGKTYLYTCLETLGFDNVLLLTYEKDHELMDFKLRYIDKNKYDLIFLDRADKYMTQELYDKLLHVSHDTTIFMDLKNPRPFTDKCLKNVCILMGRNEVSYF